MPSLLAEKLFPHEGWNRHAGTVARWGVVAATLASCGYLVVRHTRPWDGAMSVPAAVGLLILVLVVWSPYALWRFRDRGRVTPAMVLVPVVALATLATVTSPTFATWRWRRSEAAFVAVNQSLAARWAPHHDAAGGRRIGSIDVKVIYHTDSGETWYIARRELDTGSLCESAVVYETHPDQVVGAIGWHHLDGLWWGVDQCLD